MRSPGERIQRLREYRREEAAKQAALWRRDRWRITFKRDVLVRDGHRCQTCGETKELRVVYNRTPRHGGMPLPENLITLCPPCSSRKGTRYIPSFVPVPIDMPDEVRARIERDCIDADAEGGA